MWFRWQRHAVGWCVEAHHIERPKDEEGYTSAVEVPADCIADDGKDKLPMFGKLQARFPAPNEAG